MLRFVASIRPPWMLRSQPAEDPYTREHSLIMPTHLHDPSICYLNHGAFGGTPKELLEEQHRLRLLMEAEPVDFLVRNNEARGMRRSHRSRGS